MIESGSFDCDYEDVSQRQELSVHTKRILVSVSVFTKSSIHEKLECLSISMLFGISLGLYCDTSRVKAILVK